MSKDMKLGTINLFLSGNHQINLVFLSLNRNFGLWPKLLHLGIKKNGFFCSALDFS